MRQLSLQCQRLFAYRHGNHHAHLNDKLATVALNKRILATGGSISAGDLQDQRTWLFENLPSDGGYGSVFPRWSGKVYMDGHVLVQNETIERWNTTKTPMEPLDCSKTDAVALPSQIVARSVWRSYQRIRKSDEMLSSLNDWLLPCLTSTPYIRLGLTKVVIQV